MTRVDGGCINKDDDGDCIEIFGFPWRLFSKTVFSLGYILFNMQNINLDLGSGKQVVSMRTKC